MRAIGSILVALCALAGCRVDGLGSHPAYLACDSDADCENAGRCVDGFCLTSDAGVDAGLACSDDCYSGPSETRNVGACREGRVVCDPDVEPACKGEWLPEAERCNGADDDCDGAIDEDADENTACSTGEAGVCGEGQKRCLDGAQRCVRTTAPTIERCNDLDDDCNGTVDDEAGSVCYPADTPGCTQEGTKLVCRGQCMTGTQTCTDGSPGTCEGAVLPGEEVCTTDGIAIDEDCDGAVDEGCACEGEGTQPCFPGSPTAAGVGACAAGTQRCQDGVYGACSEAASPRAEDCGNQGVDDDCDGVIDDVPDVGTPCTDDANHGICHAGSLACVDGDLTCVTPMAGTESLCDDRDEDCDGHVDETFDLLEDEANCGACGETCEDGLSCCGGDCVGLLVDERNCGGCDIRCDAQETCSNGTCCAAGLTACGGTCVDTQTNDDHCGGCNADCGALLSCRRGACVLL